MPDEYTCLQCCDSLYKVLLDYFDNAKSEEERLNSCRYAITFLVPKVENRILNCDVEYQKDYYLIYQKSMALAGRRSLEHFFDYMEMDNQRRVLNERRSVLKPLLFYLNKITFSEELEYIIASYPPSTGKSITLTYYTAWLYGLDRNNSVIRMSYSDDLVAGFSRAVREIIVDPRYSDVFPEYKKYNGNPFATKEVYNWKLKDSNVQASHIAVSRDGQVTGKRANKAMIFDDMIKGADESVDTNVHTKIYNQWITDWSSRKDGNHTKFIFIGTMWSPEDILNRIIEDREKLSPLEPDRHFKFTQISKDKSTVVIKVPMLDENDETTCKAVMTTKKARELRDVADPFQWACVYQQDPIPAEGLDFADDLLQHFESLPIDEDGNPLCDDYALAVLDTTRKGKDNASMPIFKSDGQNHYYLVDCIFKKKAMTDLYEEIIAKIEEHQITWLVVENNTDTSLKTLLDKMLEEKGILYCNITEKYQGNRRKELRIKDTQGIIRKMIYFKPKNKYKPNSDYGRLMKNLTTYSFDYPNRNDDAPDSLALFASEIILERGKPSKPIPVNRMSLGF